MDILLILRRNEVNNYNLSEELIRILQIIYTPGQRILIPKNGFWWLEAGVVAESPGGRHPRQHLPHQDGALDLEEAGV